MIGCMGFVKSFFNSGVTGAGQGDVVSGSGNRQGGGGTLENAIPVNETTSLLKNAQQPPIRGLFERSPSIPFDSEADREDWKPPTLSDIKTSEALRELSARSEERTQAGVVESASGVKGSLGSSPDGSGSSSSGGGTFQMDL